MTRYRVPVADPLLLEKEAWRVVEGFRLVSADGPWPDHPDVTICTFEDDDAPADLEGKLVEPTLQRVDSGPARVIARTVIAA